MSSAKEGLLAQYKPLDEWSIVGMNHYHLSGQVRLFVAMVKGGRCIHEEGSDDKDLWERLRVKAINEDEKEKP